MKLHENTALFRDAIRFTAQRMNLPPEYIEKDYWVTHVLHTLFIHEIGADTVFKGGTALSKCYKTIDRFSEDIDLVVVRREGESNNKMTTKIKTISDVVSAVLPEVDIEGLTQKMGMNRKTAHTYNKEFKGSYGQVRDVIIVEANWLGYFEPYTTKQLNSFVGEMMLTNNQVAIAEANGLMPFDVRVLEPVRTLCEKIMSLVRFSYGEDPIDDLKNKIRHTYDLHQLFRQQEFLAYFQSNEFPKLLLKVAHDDVAGYKNSNEWLAHHPNEALIFKDLDNVWNELKATYNSNLKTLVYGILPPDDSVLEILKMIRERLVGIEWNIKIPNK
jgi:predicted nucleotidyltransferase component of viral defense system